MAITANKKFWTEFIDIYRTLPCLWNTKDENYNNRESRSAAWYKLVEKLQEVEPDANQDSVKRKINTFRSNFNRELRKIRQTQKSQPNEDYNPTLWYFDRLSFLYNQEKYTNNNSSNLSTIDETYDGGDMTMMSLTTRKCELLEDSNQPETAPSINQEAITNQHYENSQMIDTNEMSRNKQKTLTEIERLIDYAPVGVIQTESKTLSNHANKSDAPAEANSFENNFELQTTTNSRKLRSCFNKRSRAHVRVQHPYYRDICSITDEAALFGQTWACEFRKLNAQQKLFAKKAINEIFLLGQLNALKLQTVPVNKTLMEMESSDN